MIIEEGKRYVRRNGILSGVIERNESAITGLDFPFRDETKIYNPSGQCWYTNQSELDLIAEYKEPEMPEMKEVDFNKPLRFSTPDKAPVHYIGLDKDGRRVCQKTTGMESIFIVDQCGRSEQFVDIENIPEKLVMWVNFYKGTAYGYKTREAADISAGPDRQSCIRVECDEGDWL